MTCNAYIDRQRHLLVFWSPKCGCTTVSRWFVESVLHKTAEFRTEKCFIGVWLDRHGHYLRHHDAYRLSAQGDYRTILFTRNPHARLASAFLNKFYVNGRSPLDSLDALEPFARGFLEQSGLVGGLGPAAYRGISFRQFVKALVAAKRAGHAVDHHWGPQFPQPLAAGLRYPSFDHVIRLEHLDGDFIPVTASLQLDPPGPGSRNRTKYPEDFSETAAFLGDHLTSQLLAERAAVRARNLYDAELLAAVDDLYAGDYARLPYSGAVV